MEAAPTPYIKQSSTAFTGLDKLQQSITACSFAQQELLDPVLRGPVLEQVIDFISGC